MNLFEYVQSFPKNKRTHVRREIAAALNVTEVFVRSMCNGHKKIPAKYAIQIERITYGAVSRHVTAPDIYPIE